MPAPAATKSILDSVHSAQCRVPASGLGWLLMAPLQDSSWPLQVLVLALALVLVPLC